MKCILLAAICFFYAHAKGQGDKNLAVNEAGDLRLIIGIVIAVLVIIAMYILLRKEDK
jgi:hypothetical protein